MTPFRIRRLVGPDGGIRVILLNVDNQPVFWPNVYATVEYHQTGKSPETIEKVLRAIAAPGLWAASIGRDFEEELGTGAILTYADAESLAPFMGLNLKSQLAAVDRWHAREPALASKVVPITSAKLERRVLARARIERRKADADSPDQKPASSEETASRIRWLAGYLRWRLQQRENVAARDQRSLDPVAFDAKAGIARLVALAPIVDSATEDDDRLEGFGPGVAERIEVALIPDSPTNPFPNDPFLRARNYLLWRIFLDTGGRRGEIRWTKIEDIERSKRRLAILNSKTMARTVAVSPRTISAFEDYVEIYSKVIPLRARKKGYLFVTIKGELLVNRSINRVFEKIRANV